MSRRSRSARARIGAPGTVLIALLIVAWAGRSWLGGSNPSDSDSAVAVEAAQGEQQVLVLFAGRQSGAMVAVEGVVSALLADDNDGSPHQRFIVRLESGHTLLIAHNIELAPRVPLRIGDAVQVRGQYEWNDRGGVLHWTHHDPAGNRPGGWIELDGARYR